MIQDESKASQRVPLVDEVQLNQGLSEDFIFP